MMCRVRLMRRLPARESRWRCLVAGGGVQRGGAVPGGEPVAVGEAADVADVGQQPGGPEGPMPCRSISVEPRASDQVA